MNKDVSVHQVPNTPILVDAFRQYHRPAAGPRTEALFFLTHYHGDHYQGLNAEWSTGRIYCSEITARLLTHVMGIQPQYVRALPMDVEVSLPCDEEGGKEGGREGGLTVTLLDANHCPGACMLLFKVPDFSSGERGGGGRRAGGVGATATAQQAKGGSTNMRSNSGSGSSSSRSSNNDSYKLFLHCGDMRFHPKMLSYPALLQQPQHEQQQQQQQQQTGSSSHASNNKAGRKGGKGEAVARKIDTVFLDTTYCHPRYDFAPQQDAIEMIGDLILERLREEGREGGREGDEAEKAASQTSSSSSSSPVPEKHQEEVTKEAEHNLSSSLPPSLPPKKRHKTLFLLSAYKLGKERVLIDVVRRTNLPIYVDDAKMKVLECLDLPPSLPPSLPSSSQGDKGQGKTIPSPPPSSSQGDEGGNESSLPASASSYFTLDKSKTCLHVCRMGFCGEMWPFYKPNFVNLEKKLEEEAREGGKEERREGGTGGVLEKRMDEETGKVLQEGGEEGGREGGREGGWGRGYTRIYAFIPTGWAEGSKYNIRNAIREKFDEDEGEGGREGKVAKVTIQLVPYSEHTPFPDLMTFVKFLRPREVVPTVWGDAKSKERMVKRFRGLVDATEGKRAFLSLFSRKEGGREGGKEEGEVVCLECEEEEEGMGEGEEKGGKGGGDTKAAEIVCLEGEEEEVEQEEEEATNKAVLALQVPATAAAAAAPAVVINRRQQQWACGACTFVQQSTEAACALCQTPREGGKEDEDQGRKGKKGNDRKEGEGVQGKREKEAGKDQAPNRGGGAPATAKTTKGGGEKEKDAEAGRVASSTDPNKRQKTLFAYLRKIEGV